MSGVIIGVMSLIMSVFFGVRRRLQGIDTRPAEVVNHKRALDLSIAASVRERDKTHAVARWHFTTNDVRIKLKSLHPSL